ncbi:hypothetical protein [Streptomyces sp. NBC_00847]|uniref:hypothetical protein n=1 Tax=unclassified Streptomyces TaxID=2593676 RepID=UPI002254D8F0|nr:hypothetical protein [Streptomyces sp. NBC_00847]MCX4878183.1 hypothetical protein [Streptomyces sp. NBC_00847]
MAVLDGTWWSAWWSSMAWWLAAFAGLLVLAGYGVRRVLRRRETGTGPNYLPLYLDNDAVMNLYEMGNYKAAMRREIEERRIRSAGCLAVIPFVSLLFKVAGRASTEVVAKYVEESKPMSVIGLLLSLLRSKDGIVEVLLQPETVTPNAALVARLGRRAAGEGPSGEVALTEIGEFVMVTARFEAQVGSGETLVMRAPYGEGGVSSAHLRVILRREGLHRANKELPTGQFQAHCLGKVTSWDARAHDVVLEHPIAIFL